MAHCRYFYKSKFLLNYIIVKLLFW